MTIKQFALESIADINEGAIRDDFDGQLAALVADCMKRPGLDKTRVLTLKIELTPTADGAGGCEHVDMRAQVLAKWPASVVEVPKMQPRKSRAGNMLVFDTEQLSLFPEEP